MIRRYIDFAIIWDLLIVVIFAITLFFFKQQLKLIFGTPAILSIQNFIVSLITVCAALIGFILTIITVIVTFKKGFESDDKQKIEKSKKIEEIPSITVFDKIITKEQQFYGSDIHKKVVETFILSTYEIATTLCILLIIQFDIIKCSIFTISLISSSLFLLVILSITRSLYIFKLFLNVHLHDKSTDD